MHQRTGDVQDRLTGADPLAFRIDQVDLELGAALLGAETTGRRMKTA